MLYIVSPCSGLLSTDRMSKTIRYNTASSRRRRHYSRSPPSLTESLFSSSSAIPWTLFARLPGRTDTTGTAGDILEVDGLCAALGDPLALARLTLAGWLASSRRVLLLPPLDSCCVFPADGAFDWVLATGAVGRAGVELPCECFSASSVRWSAAITAFAAWLA